MMWKAVSIAPFAALGAAISLVVAADQAGEFAHRFTNRLVNSDNPYLLLHAHNPVDWYT